MNASPISECFKLQALQSFKLRITFSRKTLHPLLSTYSPLFSLTRSSPCASHSPRSFPSAGLIVPGTNPPVAENTTIQGRDYLWFLPSLEAFLDLTRNGQALSTLPG
ncbi:hypothetical protein ARMGADRAFT_1014627 [Armillaria gallica]|uniref:Uncharacterized protein n=1 Tax=Armillaria gallica TaxID=47427 RepID=A0A2H3D9U1_ARMGA|nr:hypothetical protein ARMGADRAFT_1014627 [Armillaria gallica]